VVTFFFNNKQKNERQPSESFFILILQWVWRYVQNVSDSTHWIRKWYR